MANGLIDGTEVSLVNVYAPNEDDPNFIRRLFNVLIQYRSGLLLMGGDFNCTTSQLMGRHPPSKTPLSKMSRMFKYQSTETGLVDIWRSKFPKSKDFTFYSSRHASYSRIDYFFTPKVELHRIKDI